MKLKMTGVYLERSAEPKKIKFINDFASECETILDFGCGNGLYGQALKLKCKYLIGMDFDKNFLDKCEKLKVYQLLLNEKCSLINRGKNMIDVFFASEVIEHMPELESIMNEVERITSQKILLTMPNPLYPHFRDDPTHILEYSINSLFKNLNRSKKFKYEIKGLGFENIPGPKFLKKINQFFLWNFPKISPTIAVIGEKI